MEQICPHFGWQEGYGAVAWVLLKLSARDDKLPIRTSITARWALLKNGPSCWRQCARARIRATGILSPAPKNGPGSWRGKMVGSPRAPQAPPWALFFRPAKKRPGWSAFKDRENVETPGSASRTGPPAAGFVLRSSANAGRRPARYSSNWSSTSPPRYCCQGSARSRCR